MFDREAFRGFLWRRIESGLRQIGADPDVTGIALGVIITYCEAWHAATGDTERALTAWTRVREEIDADTDTGEDLSWLSGVIRAFVEGEIGLLGDVARDTDDAGTPPG